MAGSQPGRSRLARPLPWLAVLILSLGAPAGAQFTPPSVRSGEVQALDSPAPPNGMPTPHLTDFDDLTESPAVDEFTAREQIRIPETIVRSAIGHPDPDDWKPLTLSTLLREGWDEPWVPSPRGSGGAPRQGWINAVSGNLQRGGFFTFAQGFNAPPEGNAYLGSFTLMTPLSRRLMLTTNVPFALRNNVESGQPIIDPPGPTVEAKRSQSGFGDMSFTPRVLLHETRDFSLTSELAVLTPTGVRPLAGRTALTPAIGFWTSLADGWAVRGGIGTLVPTRGGGSTLIGQFAVGQTLTEHDVPLVGDFTYYLSTVVSSPLSEGGRTSVTLTPGLRSHLGRNWYLLAGLPTPLTRARVADLGLVLWFVKSW